MNAAAPTRAGFTLLEVMLAATIGSIVALVAIGLMSTLNRADSKLSNRYREITQLERAHKIMSRAFSSILVADRTNVRVNRSRNAASAQADANVASNGSNGTNSNSPGNRAASKGGTGNRTTATPETTGAPTDGAPGSKASQQPKIDQPPRIALGGDGGVNGLGMARPSNARLTMGEVQRFEMVLAASPVPQRTTARSRARMAEAVRTSMFDSDDENAERSSMPDTTGQAIRGVFELRPAAAEGRPMFAPDGTVRSWTLWWRPLPRLVQNGNGEVRQVGVAPSEPVEVATDLAYCRWQVFDNRERKSDYAAVYFTDLPAYIEMEVQTTSGLWANWMFEVDWATGSEDAGNADDDESGDESESTGSASRTYENLSLPATGGDK